MPTVTLNRGVFEKLVGKKFSDEQLKERISMLGTDLDSLDKNEIQVEIFPNRPDLLSEQGFARAFSSFTGVKTGLKKYDVKKSGHKVIVDKSVSMRPYSVCALVKNIKFTDERIRETMQVQEKLSTTHGRGRKKSEYGVYPSYNIKFPIRYVAKDPKTVTFTPLGFDKPMTGDKVEQVHPTGKEYHHIAKDWTLYPFFMDSEDKVLSMLPYTNSNDMGKVEESTKEVFIECTGMDLQNVQIALNIIVTTLADMGGEIYSTDMVYPDKTITTPNLEPSKLKVDLSYVNKKLGFKLTESDLRKLLERMGYGYEKNHALVPAYRGDILHQIDLVEDIAIAYGYENIPEVIPKVATIAEENKFEKFMKRVAEILVGLGLIECETYHITSMDNQTKLMNVKIEVIELGNALNLEYSVLTSWKIPLLMEVLQNNKHHEYPQNIFTIGTIFKKGNSDTGVIENDRIACLLCGEDVDYTRIRQALDYLLRMLDLEYKIEETEHSSFIPGRVGRVIVKNKKVAYIGEIAPGVLKNWELEMPVAGFELNLSELYSLI